jgi:zinc/manganese transport system substrate-binding protein
MKRIILAVLLILFMSRPVFAEINVVATLPWIGSVANEIGGGRIGVTVLVKPGQDPHMIEAKPSMILAGRKADILMFNGLDLEIGYVPLIVEGSRNPNIQPGRPGSFDCSRFVSPIEVPVSVDRSLGDVHPFGNPHYHFSPAEILRVAGGMAEAMAALDPPGAEAYRANYERFAAKLREREKTWGAVPLRGKSFIAHHKMFEYLARDHGFRIDGYVEPKPGIPPSASHIESLIASMKTKKPDGILITSYQGRKEGAFLSEKTGVKLILMPHDVGSQKGTDDWFAFMDRVMENLR